MCLCGGSRENNGKFYDVLEVAVGCRRRSARCLQPLTCLRPLDGSRRPLNARRTATTRFWIVAIVCAASRFLAMARTLWDWDEALFCLGMRAYDVTMPPSASARISGVHRHRRIVRLVMRERLPRAAGGQSHLRRAALPGDVSSRHASCGCASRRRRSPRALCAFFPNVWFFGGTAFSDVPSIVLVIVAVAMLIRGCRDAEAYLIGTLLLALAIGIRPQNLLVGSWPGSSRRGIALRQNWRDVVLAALIGVDRSPASRTAPR